MAEGTPLTEEGLAKLLAKQQKQTTSGGGKGPSGPSSIDLGVDTFKKAVDPFGSALGVAGKGVSALSDAVNSGVDSWRDLSKSGAGFNNDIVGMTVAAAGTRLPLKDFAGVIKDNTDILGQLGGSVTRGAESFAKMSKSFFESGATDSLKQLGYTNKDLNEVLALQAITLRGKFKDDQQRDAVAIENASKLATEMDLMAKLTGKSREAQMEQMKKNQMDMQFEAAIRLKTAGMSAEEAAKFEANARTQLKDAQLRGSGDMFKEVFATGQIMSKEAAMQAAVNQEQAAATQRQAQASARGDENAANAANREAQRAAVADANDKTKLGMVALGAAGGVASKALTDSMGAQITYTKSLEATAAANGYDLKTKEGLIQAQQKMEEEAKKAAAGQDEKGKQVDGATKAAVALENTTDKVRAGLITGLLTPLNEKVGPELGKFANNLGAMNKNFGGTGKDTSRAIEDATKKGFEQGASDKPTSRYERTAGPGGLLGIAEGIGGAASGVATVANKGIGAVNTAMEPKKRQGGSMDMTGGMFENWGKGEMVELHGMEGVMRPQDIEKIVETSLGGAKKAISSATPSMPKGGLDISKISKDISTSVSSVGGGGSTTVKGPDLAELTRPFETSFNDFGKEAKKFIKFDNLTTSFENSFDDFGSEITKYANIDDLMTPFEDSFSSFNLGFEDLIVQSSEDIADAMGGSKASAAQAKIDEAIAEKQKALDKIVYMLNEVSDEEFDQSAWDDAIAERDEAQKKLDKVVEDSMSDLASGLDDFSDGWSESIDKVSTDISDAIPYDEFGGIDKAIADQKAMNEGSDFDAFYDQGPAMQEAVAASSPTATQSRGITADSFTLGPNGMPIAKPKSTAAAAPDKKPEEKTAEEQAKDREAKAKADMAAGPQGEKSVKKEGSSNDKAATLDDVVKSLNALNTKMGQLISVNEDGHKSTAKAAKSGGANLYNK